METIRDIGEKRLISEVIRPFFNPENDACGVGDDCAVLTVPVGHVMLVSTDRVPSDLIALRLGLLDYRGFGRYLATLNVSDIAASGGTPIALLLNFGLPADFRVADLIELCTGARDLASECGARIVGGDLSSSSELSCSATAIGSVRQDQVLLRRGARVGDTLFVSRSVGLTPAAFAHYLILPPLPLETGEVALLNEQFSSLTPLIKLGVDLAQSECCTSCMDNTDGIGQTLSELSQASGLGCVIDAAALPISMLVRKCAALRAVDVFDLALSAGADFSLVGTLKGSWTQAEAEKRFGGRVWIIGRTAREAGVWLESDGGRREIRFGGWDYFRNQRPFLLGDAVAP